SRRRHTVSKRDWSTDVCSSDLEKGIPTAIDGVEMDGPTLVKKLNKLGGENGIGLADIVENRLVGMKSRGVYETPGGTILYHAHEIGRASCRERVRVDGVGVASM